MCGAVQHAHQKGVVHRDLKPSNVLVEERDGRPVPKVIDFGVAKAAGQPLTDKTLMTGFGAVVGTPEYMSPEQASFNQLDVDTRADIYALGVLLYELLTGSTPVDRKSLGKAAVLEVLRIVREEEPPRPSQKLSTADALPAIAANRHTESRHLARLVRGDLDWIVMKALEKDRTRRYETANGLAADVGRYLAGEPVAAGPPSAAYRVRKFVRRHRGRVAAAAVVLLALVGGVVGTALGLVRARDAEGQARTEAANARDERDAKEQARQAEAVARKRARAALDTLTSDALKNWFTRARFLESHQKDLLRRLLDEYTAFAGEVGDDPDARRGQVRAMLRVGRIQAALGDRPAAGASFRRAVELAGTAAAPVADDPDGWELVADAHDESGVFHHDGSRDDEAERCYREGLAARVRVRDADPSRHRLRYLAAERRLGLAPTLGEQNRFDEADAEGRAATAELEQLVRENPAATEYLTTLGAHLNNQAVSLKKRGHLADALAANGRAVELPRKVAGQNSVLGVDSLFRSLRLRADLLIALEKPAESEAVRQESIGHALRLADDRPSVPVYRVWVSESYQGLARSLERQGRHAEAAEAARRGVAAARVLAAEFADDLPAGAALVGALLDQTQVLDQGRAFGESEAAARAALAEADRLIRTFGERPDLSATRAEVFTTLGVTLLHVGRFAEAEAAMREGIAVLAALARDQPRVAARWRSLFAAQTRLAEILVDRWEVAAAETELRAALATADHFSEQDRGQKRPFVDYLLAKATGRGGAVGRVGGVGRPGDRGVRRAAPAEPEGRVVPGHAEPVPLAPGDGPGPARPARRRGGRLGGGRRPGRRPG
ncbi:MAG: serine/threonine protein kinase, partial [Gemmataceae bacterium]|nr:serine/threonine protein kinase [Gemmataceae bacterium]